MKSKEKKGPYVANSFIKAAKTKINIKKTKVFHVYGRPKIREPRKNKACL
jgi:hypothetical protein